MTDTDRIIEALLKLETRVGDLEFRMDRIASNLGDLELRVSDVESKLNDLGPKIEQVSTVNERRSECTMRSWSRDN